MARTTSLGKILRSIGHALLDLACALIGREHRVALVAEPGEGFAMMDWPGWKEDYLKLAAGSETWTNSMPARSILAVNGYNPIDKAAKIECPVLIISGRNPLRFTDELADRLKEYVNQGGCILFEADGGDGCGDASGFERSVSRLCESWFEGAKLERLPPSHPIWFAEHNVEPTAIGDGSRVWSQSAMAAQAAALVNPRL